MSLTVSAVLSILFSVLRVSSPLIFAAMGGLLCERSGVIQIALEGILLFGAFWAAAVAFWTQNGLLGFMAGGLAGGVCSLLYGLFVLRLRANQIVAGTAINFLAMGLTPFLSKIFFQSTGSTPSLEIAARLDLLPLVFVWILAGAVAYFYSFTRGGLWLQIAGEKPEALQVAGYSVERVRWWALLFGGIFAGWGGAILSIGMSSSFTRNMSAGRGYMALAALILGKWKPIPTVLGCLAFGVAEVAQLRLQGVHFLNFGEIPVQWIQILPYVLTLLMLGRWFGETRSPAALGRV